MNLPLIKPATMFLLKFVLNTVLDEIKTTSHNIVPESGILKLKNSNSNKTGLG